MKWLLILLFTVGLFAQSIQQRHLSVIKKRTGGGVSIVFDAVSEANEQDENETISWSHTVGVGSNRFLWVALAVYDYTAAVAPSSVTFNSDALTLAGTGTLASEAKVFCYYMVAPDEGSHTILATFDDPVDEVSTGATSWFGVDQSTPVSDINDDSGSNPSISVTVDAGDVVMDGMFFYTGAATAGGGQVERWNTLQGGDVTSCAGSTELSVGGGSVTMSWTNSETAYFICEVNVAN